MATFNGIYPTPPLDIAPCGLLSVARVVKHSDEDEHWLNLGYTETDAYPKVVIQTNVGNTEYALSSGTGAANTQVLPFWIELNKKQTTIDFLREDFESGPFMDQIDAVSQKAVERELWDGAATRGNTTPATDGYLTKTGGASIKTSGGVTPDKALYLIEQSISDSPTGGRGIIHMTRDVASALGSRLQYEAKARDDKKAYARTRLGTLVVIGSGYTGNGPIGTAGAAASATNKWIFATGGVEVHLGKAEFTNKDVAKAINPNTNDVEVQVLRPAAVIFDPSIFSAAQVTLT